jgi:V8-like Glu-specific endopeptidase
MPFDTPNRPSGDDQGYPKKKVRLPVGELHRPLLPEELAARRPLPGTGIPPAELLALRRKHSLFIFGEGAEPDVTVTRTGLTQQFGYSDGWQVDLSLREGQYLERPRVRSTREKAEVFRAAINPDVGYSGYRPEWLDLFYLPRVVPNHGRAPMRRINGGRSTPQFRPVLHDTSYPWGCIGRVSTYHGTGTGVLIGRNIVVTAAHVVPWNDSRAISFDTRHISESAVSANVVEARGYDTVLTGYDWAILRLDQPLGDLIGYMGYNSYDDSWEGQPYWTIVGYPEGLGPFWQGGISIRDDDEDDNGGQEFESEDADTEDGDSGGPMFGWWNNDPRIIGVVSGLATEFVPFENQVNHIIAGGPGLHDLISWGRSIW